MNARTIVIVGGTGFVGSSLANALIKHGDRPRILTRSRARHRDLWLLPDTDLVEIDVYDQHALANACAGCDAVINLVGILNEQRDDGRGFYRAHVELTQNVLAACATAGVSRYLHMSALNAAATAPSHYLRTKGEAEQLVRAAAGTLEVTIFRPSVIFGPDDDFFNRFARLLQLVPVLPLACANARFQPVYLGDVVAVFMHALESRTTYGETYDLGGPEVWSLAQIVRYTAQLIGRRRLIIPLGPRLSRVQAELMEWLPGKPFSRDNLRSTRLDSVLTGANGVTQLGFTATAINAVVPMYLERRNERGRHYELRSHARR